MYFTPAITLLESISPCTMAMLEPAFCSTAAASESAMASPLEANSAVMFSASRDEAWIERASATAAVTSTVVLTSFSATPIFNPFDFAIQLPEKPDRSMDERCRIVARRPGIARHVREPDPVERLVAGRRKLQRNAARLELSHPLGRVVEALAGEVPPGFRQDGEEDAGVEISLERSEAVAGDREVRSVAHARRQIGAAVLVDGGRVLAHQRDLAIAVGGHDLGDDEVVAQLLARLLLLLAQDPQHLVRADERDVVQRHVPAGEAHVADERRAGLVGAHHHDCLDAGVAEDLELVRRAHFVELPARIG